MRARTIKPGYFSNEHLAEIDPLGRILFAGLWCVADRDGRLEDRSTRIKAQVLPYDLCDVDKLLNDLFRNGFIIRYEANGEKYIQINKFTEHQHPHQRELPSIFPAYNESEHNLGNAQARPRRCRARPIIFNPIPSNPIPSNPSPVTGSSFDDRNGFDLFWRTYPKKVQKQAAIRAWKKLGPNDLLQGMIFRDVQDKAQSDQWLKEDRQFCPHPASYLNGRRWEDEVVKEPPRDPFGFAKE